MAMCRSAGFAEVELKDVTNRRASVVCRRRWQEPGRGPAPHLHSASNNRNYTARFHPAKEEYLCCYFKSAEKELTPETIFIEVDGYGVPALTVAANGPGAWQANCIRPPGLETGPHEVRIRSAGSARSNAVEISMLDREGVETPGRGEELTSEAPELCSAEFSASGDLRIAVNRGGVLVCYFRAAVTRLGAAHVTVDTGGSVVGAHTISSLEDGVWQANVMLDRPMEDGVPVRVRLGKGAWSNACHSRRL
jgi:hypothetical protein